MWSFPMKKCGSNAKGLAELNQLKGVEQSNYRDGNSKEGHGLSEEDESRISKDFGDDRCADTVQVGTDRKISHQQPQGSNICWDRFLPTRSIKVMLVENDESTRHVVSALLRNCCYEVTAVSNGMQAWKILEGPRVQVDIVLAELTMPGLSGLHLLQKIKDTESLKSMPVIIMSSQDSMGTVFKCLSKGAIDFLVKPVRKNELKNLWQHVWRKLNCSSGSGSEGVRQTIGPAKSIGVEESNNNDSTAPDVFKLNKRMLSQGRSRGRPALLSCICPAANGPAIALSFASLSPPLRIIKDLSSLPSNVKQALLADNFPSPCGFKEVFFGSIVIG